MDGAVVVRRMIAGRPCWGVEALDMFLPFGSGHRAEAELAALTWTEGYIRSIGGLPVRICPLAPDEREGTDGDQD